MPESFIPPAAGRLRHSPTIMIVEDDSEIGKYLQLLIEDETPYRAVVVGDGYRALEQAPTVRPCLFLLDFRLPGINGIELYDRLQELEEVYEVPAIMMSATLPLNDIQRRGIYQLRKPMENDNVVRMITHALASFEEEHLTQQQHG